MESDDLIEELLRREKITQKDLDDIRAEESKRAIVDMVHQALCKKHHNNGECGWYEEEAMEHRWLEPYHAQWLELFNNFLASTELIKFIEEGVTEESSGSSDD